MNYLQLRNQILNTIAEIEEQHAELLQYKDDPEAMLEFPILDKTDYTEQTGKDISGEDFKILLYLTGLYNAIYEIDFALGLMGIEH